MELVWDEVYENERWNPRKNWRPCPVIAKFDPNHWTSKTYKKMPTKLDIRLPSSDNENRWVWVDDWKSDPWQYAISFGASIGNFSFSEQRKKNHFVRRRKWKRPRIRKIDIGVTEIVERVYENQRIFMATSWKSPYIPGDRPHYSDEHGKQMTIKQVDSRLPPQWNWADEWTVETGVHTDKDGYEYATDFIVGGWTGSYTLFQHCVRRKCWIRTRRKEGQVRATKKLKTITPSVASMLRRESRTRGPSGDQELKNMVIDVDDINVSGGWGDSDDDAGHETKFKFSGVNIC